MEDGYEVVERFVEEGRLYGVRLPEAELLELARSRSGFSRARFAPGHFTASAVLADPRGRRLLLIHHPKLGLWLQPGGHVEPSDCSIAAAAAREALEETGIRVSPSDAVPVALDIHRIPAWRQEPPHLHLDLRFLFLVSEVGPDRTGELPGRWFDLDATESREALGETLAAVESHLGAA